MKFLVDLFGRPLSFEINMPLPRLTFTFLIFQMEHYVRQQIIEGIEN